jgi:hypothetical protein
VAPLGEADLGKGRALAVGGVVDQEVERPKRASVAPTMASTAASSVTSASRTSAWPPCASISAATVSASSRALRVLTTIAAPWPASASAVARPIRRAAPVTSATLPSSGLSAGAMRQAIT